VDNGDEVRAYLRNIDRTVSKPLALGEHGRRLLAAAENRLSTLGVIRWEPAGSAFCATSVAGYSDVDMLAVFLDPIRHGVDESGLPYSMRQLRTSLDRGMPAPPVLSAGEAFELVAECLDGVGPSCGFDPPTPDFPAIRFRSRTGEPAVEVVPSIEADLLWDRAETKPSSGLVRVAFPARRDRWSGTEPGLHSSVLDQGRSGTDYTVRELIRLLKLIKYRCDVPVLSYFLELFTLRWLEGSETFAARNIAQIVEAHETAWHFRQLGLLIDDLTDLLASLAGQLRAAVETGHLATTIDLTTPESEDNNNVDACADIEQTRVAAERMETVAAKADHARIAAHAGAPSQAIAIWQAILGDITQLSATSSTDDTAATRSSGGLQTGQLHAAPLTYEVTLSGTDGVREFADVTTHLVFQPTPAPERGPVRFTLGADAYDMIGGIVWFSHLDGDHSLVAYDTSITLSGNQLSAEYHHDDPASIAVTWLRASLPLLPSGPVVAMQAHLALTFAERNIQGHVQATGMAASSRLHYRANLVGHRIAPPETPRSDQ
jgi:hypothetical protein